MASDDFFPMLAGFGCDMNFRNMGSLSRLGTTIDRSASPPTHGWLGVLSIHVADFAVSAPRDSLGSECATDAVSRRGPAARFRDGIIQLCSSCWCGYSSRSATGRASRIVPHTRIFSAKWRFTALEERPGRSCSICAHRFPRFLPGQSERAHTRLINQSATAGSNTQCRMLFEFSDFPAVPFQERCSSTQVQCCSSFRSAHRRALSLLCTHR